MTEARFSPDPKAAIIWIVLSLLFLWSISPILQPVNVEGFSAAIAGLGESLAKGDLLRFDELHPFNVEFFALSKFGAVLDVAALIRWFGLDGMTAMKVVIWVSELIFLVATAVLVRRWSGASPLVTAAVIILIPALLENSFFLNDNVPAAALAALALLCWSREPSVAKSFLGGALLGYAVLTRSDTILLAVSVPFIVYEQNNDLRQCLWLLAAAAIGGAVVCCGVLALFGASVLDVLRVGRYAVSLWSRPADFYRPYQELLIFIGCPGLFLAIIGLIEARERKLFIHIAFLVAPLLAVTVLIGDKLWQSRQLLTLAPFVATLVALGLNRIVQSSLLLRAGVIVLFAVVWLRPATAILDDGPRTLYGRLYSPWQWSDWQAHEKADVAVIDKLITAPHGKTLAIVTDDWNLERYTDQQLAKAGFELAPSREVVADCRQIAEIFSRDNRQVAHIRIDQPFVAENQLLDHERFEKLALPCLRAIAPNETVWLEYGTAFRQRDTARNRNNEPPIAFLPRFEAFLRPVYRLPVTALPLDQAGLLELNALYLNEETEEKATFGRLGRSYRSAREAMETTRRIIPFPK
jgi:hypothetical protein